MKNIFPVSIVETIVIFSFRGHKEQNRLVEMFFISEVFRTVKLPNFDITIQQYITYQLLRPTFCDKTKTLTNSVHNEWISFFPIMPFVMQTFDFNISS